MGWFRPEVPVDNEGNRSAKSELSRRPETRSDPIWTPNDNHNVHVAVELRSESVTQTSGFGALKESLITEDESVASAIERTAFEDKRNSRIAVL